MYVGDPDAVHPVLSVVDKLFVCWGTRSAKSYCVEFFIPRADLGQTHKLGGINFSSRIAAPNGPEARAFLLRTKCGGPT